jgi:hypothetical protein
MSEMRSERCTNKVQRISLAAILAGAAAIIAPAGLPAPTPTEVLPMSRLPIEGEFPSLAGVTAWLNSPPLTAGDLRGKVVLVDVWTYTCINWLRTLPYVGPGQRNTRTRGSS